MPGKDTVNIFDHADGKGAERCYCEKVVKRIWVASARLCVAMHSDMAQEREIGYRKPREDAIAFAQVQWLLVKCALVDDQVPETSATL